MSNKKKIVPESRQMIMMLGYLCVATGEEAGLGRKVEILDRFGISDEEMAIICDCKPQGVRDARQNLKKKKK
jgi:hypothetical protein